ncbi:uncharacterized protein LOC110654230 [Hevea brasiliensis]|nr:uncharacterized protein LOC110654230 [Hevea brasiliensis]
MSLFRALLLSPQNPLFNSRKPFSSPFRFAICRTLATSSSPQLEPDTQTEQNKKLSLVFQEAVGLCEKTEPDIENESQSNGVKKKLLELEREVRDLREADSKNDEGNRNVKKIETGKRKSLYAMFTGEKLGEKMETQRRESEGPRVFKEFSPDMKMLVNHLYQHGYFKDANFLRRGELDFSCFYDSYGRDYIKYAAEKFGQDQQEIAKWLSGSDLKKLALFGCPSLTKKNVFSAKRLRNYFEIKEDTVCGKCVLKDSCKFVNQSVWKGDYKTLNLAVVMRVITLYALEEVHPELPVPDEIKASVSRLLNEVVKLSETIS